MIKTNIKKTTANIGKKLNSRISEYTELKREVSILQHELKEKQSALQKYEDAFIFYLKDTNQLSASFPNGSISLKNKTRLRIVDLDVVYSYVIEHNACDLFEKRISKKAFEFYRERFKGLENGVVAVTDIALDVKGN